MKILVTGAADLVGRNLLPLLKKQWALGHCLDPEYGHRRSKITDFLSDSSLRPFNRQPLPDLPENINVVIHLCGEEIADGRLTRKRNF